MEKRKLNLVVNASGGNAGKSSLNYKLSIPTVWAKAMGISAEDRLVEVSFDGQKIVIEKIKKEQ